jgi:SWI/SNF-related matrix-associated actin-dependent regulator of chromatin subfamily A-like protein 1
LITLYPYQEDGVNFLCDPRYRGRLLADDMGVGKTIQAIAACARLNAQRVLVLCPKQVKKHWKEEFHKMGYRGVGINTLATPICIWNYDLLSQDPKRSTADTLFVRLCKLRDQLGPWDVLILDEVHLLANVDSTRTNRVFGIGGLASEQNSIAKKVLGLTGTPILKSPADFYPMLRTLWPWAFRDCQSFRDFGYKFCGGHFEGPSFVCTEATNIPEFKKRLEGFMLRRTKADIYGVNRVVPRLLKIKLPIDLRSFEWGEDNHITARRVSAENKIPELLEALGVLAEHHGKLVVFCHHKSVMQQIACFYPNSVIIRGGQTPTQRKQQIDAFTHGTRKLLVIQIRAGGTGLDGLQQICNTGMFVEDDWTPAQIEQAMGRLDRNGQTRPVTFYFVAVNHSDIEDRMREALERKRKITHDVLDN